MPLTRGQARYPVRVTDLGEPSDRRLEPLLAEIQDSSCTRYASWPWPGRRRSLATSTRRDRHRFRACRYVMRTSNGVWIAGMLCANHFGR